MFIIKNKISFCKTSIIFISIFINKSIDYIQRTDIFLTKFEKDGHELDYIKNFNSMKLNYSQEPLFFYFLKEISIISYDYTNQLNSNNNKVHIVVNLNSNYIYPLIVSINSALFNSDKNKTTLVYHVLCSNDLSKKYINKLKSILYIYRTNLEIIFYNMGNVFIKYKFEKYSQVTYYRLISPIFIPLDRIIYLDSDVLIFKDLYELYQTKFNNNYVLGFLDVLSGGIDYLGLASERYINAGIILLNLEKIRKDNKHYELLYMALNHKKLKHQDQTVINYILYPHIGILPYKFGIFNFPTIFDIKYLYLKNIRQNLSLTKLVEAFKDPSLIHLVLCYPKVWKDNSKYNGFSTRNGTIYRSTCNKYHKIWVEYAKKTPYYFEIIKKYRIKNNI